MEHVDTEDDIDIGNWKYEGPKDFVLKLINKFGRPSYIEKSPMTNEAYSVTFKDIDGFDMVRVVDSNTNKLHPYPAKIYVEGSMYFPVPKGMIGALKTASPTIMIDELNQLVTGKCASLSIAAATVQFVIDAVNGVSPPTREEYDKRMLSIIDDNKLVPEITWWEDGLNEMGSVKSMKDKKHEEFQLVIKDGHTDVASAKRQMMKIQEDVVDMYNSLMSKNNEDDLPSWWTNKLAVSSAYLNSLRDYIVYETNEGATVNAEDSFSSLLVFRDDDIAVVPVDDSDMLPPSVLQAREQNNAS